MTKSNVIDFNKNSTVATVPSTDVRDNEFLLTNYLATKKSPGTKKVYEHELRKFLEWYNDKALVDVTKWEMLAYNKYLQTKYDNDKTVQRIYSTIRNFYKWLIQMDVLESNPTEGAIQALTPQQNPNEKVMAADEVIAILNEAIKDIRDHALVAVLISTGLRVSEICNLNWNSLKISSKGNYYLHAIRKGNEEQDLPIEDDLSEILLKLRRKPLDPNDDSPIFSVLYGKEMKRITTEGVRTIISRIAKRAGVKSEVTPHWFRHTFASMTISNNASLRDVQHYLNHKTIRTTELYLHAMDNSVGKHLGINLNGDKGGK